MKDIATIKLEARIHEMLCRSTAQTLSDFVRNERDAEDGVWPDLSDHLEAQSMRIIALVRKES